MRDLIAYHLEVGNNKCLSIIALFSNAGVNPKALQYIMGHSNITMTLNYYAHATSDSAMAEMERLIA